MKIVHKKKNTNTAPLKDDYTITVLQSIFSKLNKIEKKISISLNAESKDQKNSKKRTKHSWLLDLKLYNK